MHTWDFECTEDGNQSYIGSRRRKCVLVRIHVHSTCNIICAIVSLPSFGVFNVHELQGLLTELAARHVHAVDGPDAEGDVHDGDRVRGQVGLGRLRRRKLRRRLRRLLRLHRQVRVKLQHRR